MCLSCESSDFYLRLVFRRDITTTTDWVLLVKKQSVSQFLVLFALIIMTLVVDLRLIRDGENGGLSLIHI